MPRKCTHGLSFNMVLADMCVLNTVNEKELTDHCLHTHACVCLHALCECVSVCVCARVRARVHAGGHPGVLFLRCHLPCILSQGL